MSPNTLPGPAMGPPAGDELASILVLCCNQLESTRRCLESVLRRTRPPYELVLVDNGSDDGTPGYLDELRSRPGPTRVVVIRNATNVGFPAGCNQAMATAEGRYLVLLNNDTVVTEGWLDRLVAWSRHDWPRVGLVGAVTNAAAPPQRVDVTDRDLAELDGFAARRRREYLGRAIQVDRLSGFCLLIRREVLDRVGGLDERFGLGFFEDDDLCVRARAAGFRLLVALDVFVHHSGSRTFEGLGIDREAQLRENFARFRDKWGPGPAERYRPPVPAVAVAHRERPRVSLCLIVKDEEANLPACLGSAAGLADEVVVVDTGSTDRTREVAARAGARVFEFPWVDDFAAARNESLRHARGDWAFWLDADDRLDEPDRLKLRDLLAGLKDENAAYVMKCLCVPDAPGGAETVVDHVRLFRNRPDVRWKYRVHEQILPSIRRSGGRVRRSDVVIRHVGYCDPALRRRKLERDLRLLRREVADQPDDPFTLFNLGSVFNELGRTAEALPLLRRSLERSSPGDSIVRKLYALLAQGHRRLGQAAEALAACRQGRSHSPDDAELLFQEALATRELGDPAGAEACLQRLLGARDTDHFASIDPGLTGYKARHNLAVIFREQGRDAEAESQWRSAAEERPEFLPAWLGLGELYLGSGRWDELEAVAVRLDAGPHGGGVQPALLRARGHLRRRDFAAARRLLEDAIARAPAALAPRVLLSHVLLQEGQDPAAAERALREVLSLDPNNLEARHNLAVLLG